MIGVTATVNILSDESEYVLCANCGKTLKPGEKIQISHDGQYINVTHTYDCKDAT